jgi:hypothetical protein
MHFVILCRFRVIRRGHKVQRPLGKDSANCPVCGLPSFVNANSANHSSALIPSNEFDLGTAQTGQFALLLLKHSREEPKPDDQENGVDDDCDVDAVPVRIFAFFFAMR